MFARWSQPNGYRDVLRLSLPLVASMGSTTIMHFTDRVFLGHYSVDAIAAAMPAGITSFLFMSFFLGVATYVNVFIAQYVGARAGERVGAALWQGIYFSLLAWVCLAALSFLAEPIFDLVGHPAEVRTLEINYFRLLSLGAGLGVLGPALASFFSGRGLTRAVMVVDFIGAAVNVPLNYLLINGRWGFPELGMTGSAVATIVSWGLIVVLFSLLIFTRANEAEFAVWRGRRFDRELFGRLMRYGLPGGLQFFIDIFSITLFVYLVGRLGKADLAVSNIVFSINHLSFLPMFGFTTGVSTLVGQAIGRGRPEEGRTATVSALHLTLAYMVILALVFFLLPEPLLSLFRSRDLGDAEFAGLLASGVVLLRLVALYTLFDGLNMVFFGTLRGAGDTFFLMATMGSMSLGLMVLPTWVGMEYFNFNLLSAWLCLTVYVCLLGLVLWRRYRQGQWQRMRVIEIPAQARS